MWRKANKAAVIFVRKYGPWGVMAAIAILLVLEHFDFKDNIPLEFTFLGAVVVLVYAQLEESNKELSVAIHRNLVASETITNAVIPRLYSLEECLTDLIGRINQLTRKKEITVRHIGLDLRDAWSKVELVLSNPTLQMDIKYELLMITSDHSKLGQVDTEISQWCDYVRDHALPRKIKVDVPLFAKTFKNSSRRLQFTAKEYVYLPFIHGFEIQGAVNICYMALCRWKEKGGAFEFDWGDRTYFRIIKPNSDPMQNELYKVFASTFDRHWGVSSDVSFHIDSKNA